MPTRLITSWISGHRALIKFARCFGSLLETVAVIFEMDIDLLRIYVLQSPAFSWQLRFRLTKENFEDYIRHQGSFVRTSKLYAIEGDTSPDGSPVGKKADDGEGSQSSKSSDRNGQSEFGDALWRRDRGTCVFCYSNEELEAAHILPVGQKGLLCEASNCEKYGIGSIMDTSNGMLLCRSCHRCFDANLVCIDPISGILLVADALLANEKDKWESLSNQPVSCKSYQWPSTELFKFRKDAMDSATGRRHANRSVLSC